MINLAKNNEIIKELSRNIKNNKLKDNTIVDDLFSLSLIVKYNLDIESIFLCEDYNYREDAKNIKEYLLQKAQNKYLISSKTMESLQQKKNSSYMIAIVKLPIKPLDYFNDKNFILVADGIELPGNLGTIMRTMDATKCEGLISINSITKLNNPTLVHSSRGMNLLIPQIESSYDETIQYLQKQGFTIYLCEPKLGLSYDKTNFKKKLALVIGSERYGITPDWYNHSNEKIYIPMYGEMESLNVGVATSILLYEIKQKNGNN